MEGIKYTHCPVQYFLNYFKQIQSYQQYSDNTKSNGFIVFLRFALFFKLIYSCQTDSKCGAQPNTFG